LARKLKKVKINLKGIYIVIKAKLLIAIAKATTADLDDII